MHNSQITTKPERCLSAYTSADGRPPSGLEDSVDDGPAIQAALSEGPGVVRVPPGFYRWSNVQIPAGVTVTGAENATVVRAYNGHHTIFDQSGGGNWSIRDIVLDGESREPWRQRRDLGHVGLSINDAWGFTVVGLIVRDFNGQGVCVSHTRLDEAAFCNGGLFDRLTATRNAVGVCFDERGEYVTLTNSHLLHNTAGCIIHAGNIKIVQSNIGCNLDGIVIADKYNGSHGVIGNCLINHNERYALNCTGVINGMTINACGIFYGGVRLHDCQGVQISNCQVACSVQIVGHHANGFVDNMITENGREFEFAEATLVRGNMTSVGEWRFNRMSKGIASGHRQA